MTKPLTKWTPDNIVKLEMMLDGTITVCDIAEAFGCHPATIYKVIKANGLTPPGRTETFREALSERVRRKWQDPDYRERQRENARRPWRDPAYRERAVAMLRRERWGRIAEWCPEHHRETYVQLKRKGYRAAERRAIIEQDIAREARRGGQ